MIRFFVVTCVCIASLTGAVSAVAIQETPGNGTATPETAASVTTVTEREAVPSSSTTTRRRAPTTGTGSATITPTASTTITPTASTTASQNSPISNETATAPTATADRDSPTSGGRSFENVSAEVSLDEYAKVVDYRMSDGAMIVEVYLDRETTISATERVESEGAFNVRFQEYQFLDAGRHTLRFDTLSNQSASVLWFTQRGIRDGRAAQLNIDKSSSPIQGVRPTDPVLTGLAVALLMTLGVGYEAVKVRYGLGQEGEQVA